MSTLSLDDLGAAARRALGLEPCLRCRRHPGERDRVLPIALVVPQEETTPPVAADPVETAARVGPPGVSGSDRDRQKLSRRLARNRLVSNS